ncbi:MAG: hypothetical protein RJQ04_20630 [Longimicrobiales bacterium]
MPFRTECTRRVGSAPRHVAAMALAAVVAACGPSDAPDGVAEVVVRDSAGVRIVENPAGPVDTVQVGEPLLTIGHEGDPRYEFARVVFVGGLSDGRVVVADAGAAEVRIYTSDGTYEGATGGAGDGPGEYRFLNGAQTLPGDTVAALDLRLRRVSYLGPDGQFARSTSWTEAMGERDTSATLCGLPGNDGVVGGRLLMRGWSCLTERGVEGLVSYVHTFRLWDPDSETADTLGTVEYFQVWERPDRELREQFVPWRFLAGTMAAPWADGVFLPSHLAHELTVYGTDGSLRMRVVDREPLRPVTEAVRDTWTAQADSAQRALYDGVPFPDSVPAFFRGVRADDAFWARHYDIPGATGEHWRVYGDDGVRRGVVAFPEGFELQSVSGGKAYGVVRDAFDVQRPRVYSVPPWPER